MGKKISIISLFILISFSLIFCAVYNVSTPAEFQNALNSAAASSEDDIIQVSTGIYDFSETATYKTNGGSGKLTIIGGSSSPEDTSFSVKHGVNKLIVINTDQDNNGGDNSDDIVIKNILFKNAPVKIYGSEANITVYNCYFWYLSQLFISSDSGYVDIENSYFFHNSTSIRLNKTPNVFIANNIIYDNDWGIYGYFSGSTRIKIINNLICDSSNFGVDFWNDFYPHKNNKENALFEIYNNIIRSNESDLHITRGHGYGVTLNLFNNDFDDDADFDNPSSGDLRIEDTSDYHHGGNIKSDPLFVDVDSQNFHLQPDSPCIDAGNDGAPSLPSKDYDGRDRIIGPHVDMGPYEEDDVDIEVSKSDSQDPVSPGDTLTYTITVKNNGPSTALDVSVSDNIPLEILNPQYSTDGGNTWNDWSGSLTIGDMSSGDTYTFLIRGTVDPTIGATTTINNTASANANTHDYNPDNSSDTESTLIRVLADLSITKSDNPDPVVAGSSTLTYTINVSNGGPNYASDVVLNDDIPQEVENPEYSIDGGNTWNVWSGSLNLGTLSNGSSKTILIRGTVTPWAIGTISNSASISSNADDNNTSNNSATESTTINTSADLSITKSDGSDPVIAGNELTYTIRVNNSGPSDSRNVVVSDTIPSNLQNPEYSLDGGSTWNSWSGSLNLGTISSGENREILIRGVVDLSTQHNFHIENRATVSSDTDDPDTSNNEGSADTRVINITDLEIREEIDSQNYSVGDEINFTITLTNHGPQRAFNTVVRDLLIPGVFTYISSVATRGSYDSGSGIWNVGDMDSGESDTLIIRARVEKEGEYKNVCYAETTTKDSDYSNNSSMVFINRSDFVDIGVYVASDVSDVNGGDSFWYHVYVRNFGNEKTNGVRISDVFPGNLLELIDFNASKGSYDNNSGIWDIGELLPGDFAELDLNVRANPNEENGEIIYETHLESLDGEDVNNLNNYSSAIVNKEESRVDISVDKVKGGDIYSGYEGYFVISVRNLGPDDATGVVINDVLPDELGYISSTATSGSYDSTSGNWNVGDLSSGDVAILLIEIVGNANGNFTNKAEVSGVNEEDIDLRNNSDECVMKVSGVDAKIEVSVDDRCPYAGEPISIHFKVLNDNPAAIKYAKVETGIPSEMKIVSVSGDGTFNEISREWILSNVLPDESATLNVRCYQNEETDHSNGRHKYTAKIVEIIPIDTDESNNVCEYLILLDKKSNSDVYINTSIDNKIPRVGDVVGMHFQVGNSGPDPVYSLSGYIFLNGAVDFRGGGGYGVILNYPEFFIPELMAGESVGFTVNIIPLEERDYFYYGELNADLINDGNLRNNEAPGRFSTRRIYHFIPGGNGIGGSNGSKLDIDGDNKLSVVDLYKLLNVIVGNIIPQEKSKYDLNEDGKIDEKDALILRIYLSGEVY